MVMSPSSCEGCSFHFTQHRVRALCCFTAVQEQRKLRERDRQTDGEVITFTVMCDYNLVVLSVSYCVLFISQILSWV